ncbi:MAG: tetratricopeptide repeat protein [Planctomycetota bacterium]
MRNRILLMLWSGLVCCHAPQPEPKQSENTVALLQRGRSLPLDREHAQEYRETWVEILETAEDEELRAEARYNLGCAELRARRSSEARRWFEQAVAGQQSAPGRTRSCYQLAQIELEAREYEGALASFEAYLAGNPDNRYWMAASGYLRGKCLVELRREEEARKALEEFLASCETPDRHSSASVAAARGLLAKLNRTSE